MINTSKQVEVGSQRLGKNLGYSEIVELLNAQWQPKLIDPSKTNIKKLDAALQHPSQKMKVIVVAGANGKSLTINFISQLLKEENIKVGAFYSPHLLAYNERFSINNETISNKNFQDAANEVIAVAESLKLELHARDLLTMIALHHFATQKVDVAIVEAVDAVADDSVMITKPVIGAITRIDEEGAHVTADSARKTLEQYKGLFNKDAWVVSADQSKLNLQTMELMCNETSAQWAMPIRKLAALPYPFEQLHGRCAALAERVAQIYVASFTNINSTLVDDSLLAKPKGTRGRPTLEAKRHAELNPKRTLEQFWKETVATLPGRFQLLDKESPIVLLDNASNLDAFKNLLLGIRLLHYQRPLKGLAIVVGCEDNALQNTEFLKLIRYFFKKTSGQIIFCPIVKDCMSLNKADAIWNVEQVTNDVKNVKVKARSAKNLADALDQAKKLVDEKHGLIVVTGSRTLISEYWHLTGAKKA